MPAKKTSICPESNKTIRLSCKLSGVVQGVGFRPFIYRLATDMSLSGWVRNTPQGVQIEVEGCANDLKEFIRRIYLEKPTASVINSCETTRIEPIAERDFSISQSDESCEKIAPVTPDLAICSDCLREMFDPDDRRYRYAFINCTNCGPRYSIVESLPYDRKFTTMKNFTMCDSCQAEYDNPLSRRFHAQPNACPKCGPQLELWNVKGKILGRNNECFPFCREAILAGKILAIKGLGGFQLMVDARNDEAIKLLRSRKSREKKPLALMFPDIEAVRKNCCISHFEEALLHSSASPIILLKRKAIKGLADSDISSLVAPENPYLGAMLPYTPLHHLFMRELDFPVVATSGNLSDEPICIDEFEALSRLKDIADLFLIHNRPIMRQVDDSVVRVIKGREMVLRNARGYAPATFVLNTPIPSCLAVGAHLKNSIAISINDHAILSQHIGDLDTFEATSAFRNVIDSLSDIYDFKAEMTISDRHPDYFSARFAREKSLPSKTVQHHFAHVLSCLADNGLNENALGVSWDGTGLGLDYTIWGGEFLKVSKGSFDRMAHLRTFCLPGNEKAIVEPRRAALGLLYEIFGRRLFSDSDINHFLRFKFEERNLLQQMLDNKVNSPITSSAGRLFDAVASLLDICQVAEFEGQAAMALEFAAEQANCSDLYQFNIAHNLRPSVIDWEPIIHGMIGDLSHSVNKNIIAAKFHNTLSAIIIAAAKISGEKNIVMTGGCFQNKYLLERTITELELNDFSPIWHRRIPPNDGGLALGQIAAITFQDSME